MPSKARPDYPEMPSDTAEPNLFDLMRELLRLMERQNELTERVGDRLTRLLGLVEGP